MPFDPVSDFTPIVHTTTVPLVLAVNSTVPAKSVKDLVAHAQAAAGSLTTRRRAKAVRILARPDMRQRLIDSGADPGGCSPKQFGALIKSEIVKSSKVVKTVKLDIVQR